MTNITCKVMREATDLQLCYSYNCVEVIFYKVIRSC